MCKYKVYFDKKIKKDFKKLDKKVLKLLLDWIENNLESIENTRRPVLLFRSQVGFATNN